MEKSSPGKGGAQPRLRLPATGVKSNGAVGSERRGAEVAASVPLSVSKERPGGRDADRLARWLSTATGATGPAIERRAARAS